MSTSVQEHGDVQNEDINQIDLTALEGRIRSMSEVYSVDSLYASVSSPDSKPSGDLPSFGRNTSPMIGEDIPSPNNSFSTTEIVHGIVGGEAVLKKRHETRGRLFSELSISDMPTEVSTEPLPSLDISFPCKYEENMEKRGRSIVQLRQAAIKRVVIRFGARMGRYNIIFTKDKYYWPQETIRHCRTGRIKRGMILKRQFGVYYPDKTKDLIALKVMEKSAISECFQWMKMMFRLN